MKGKTPKTVLIAIIIIIIIIAALIVLKHHHSRVLSTVTVKLGSIKEEVVAAGQIIPQNFTKIKSPISGTIDKIYVHEGEHVKKGQLLLSIQPNPTPDEIVNAFVDVQKAKSALNVASDILNRKKKLLEKHYLSKQDYDQTLRDFDSTKWEYKRTLAEYQLLKQGKTSLGDLTIRGSVHSPVDGYIIQKNVNVGDSVVPVTQSQSGTVLLVVADMNHLIFKGEISQLDVNKVMPGVMATIQIASLPKLKITSQIHDIDLMSQQNNVAQESSQSIFDEPQFYSYGFKLETSKLNLPQNIKLRAGSQATATVIVNSKKNIPIISEGMLHFDGAKPYVWLFAKDNPKKEYLTLGISDGVNVEVRQGLQVGSKVLENYTPRENS